MLMQRLPGSGFSPGSIAGIAACLHWNGWVEVVFAVPLDRMPKSDLIRQHRRQVRYHLPVAVVSGFQPAPDPFHRRRQFPAPERCTVAERAGLAHQHRDVVPWS